MEKTKKLVAFMVAAGLLAVAPLPGTAQQAQTAVSFLSGPSQYDLSGTGTTQFLSVRLDVPLTSALLVEPGLTYLPYEAQSGARTHHVLPEIQLQLQAPGETFRPYLGAGFGGSWARRSGEGYWDGTLSGAGGLRVMTGSRWMLRGELRVRVIDPWAGTTADWSLGAGYRF